MTREELIKLMQDAINNNSDIKTLCEYDLFIIKYVINQLKENKVSIGDFAIGVDLLFNNSENEDVLKYLIKKGDNKELIKYVENNEKEIKETYTDESLYTTPVQHILNTLFFFFMIFTFEYLDYDFETSDVGFKEFLFLKLEI